MQLFFTSAVTADGRQKLTRDRVFWVHDLDGVHHRYDGIADIYDFYAKIKFKTVNPHFPRLSRTKVKVIGLDSHNQTGDGLLLFSNYAREQGMPEHEIPVFREKIFRTFHQHGLAYLREHAPDIFKPCPTSLQGFERLKPFVRHGVLTQSCGIHWGRPILTDQRKIDYFDPLAIIDFAATNYRAKALSYEALAFIMSVMGARPEETVFIEDSPRNLERAKELDPRILTVYVCHDLPLSPLPGYIDLQVRNIADLLHMAADLHPHAQPAEEMKFTV